MQQQRKHVNQIGLVVGIEICCEVDDVSCLGIIDKCRRLDKLAVVSKLQSFYLKGRSEDTT